MPGVNQKQELSNYRKGLILLGPIVGECNSLKTILLLKTIEDCELTAIFSCDDDDTTVNIKSIFKKNIPSTIQLIGLREGKMYRYWINDNMGQRCTEFYNLRVPDRSLHPKIIVVSCNRLETLRENPKAINLWRVIKARHLPLCAEPIDLLLHIGDQIYESTHNTYRLIIAFYEEIYKKSYIMGSEMNRLASLMGYKGHDFLSERVYEKTDIDDIALQMYSDLYTVQWSDEDMRVVLASISNHMVIDDHDVHNGFGIHDYDRVDGYHLDAAKRGLKAYDLHQAQLWRDPNIDLKHPDYRYIKFGKILIIFMDVRKSRTVYHDKNYPYISLQQLSFIEEVLEKYTDINGLLVVSSIPIFCCSNIAAFAGSFVDVTDDCRDQYNTPKYRKDHEKLLDIFKSWKLKDVNRSVMLIGGDIHMGYRSEINCHVTGDELFKQVITSPVSNEPTVGKDKDIQLIAMHSPFQLYGKFNVVHEHNKTFERNFCVLRPSVCDDPWKYSSLLYTN